MRDIDSSRFYNLIAEDGYNIVFNDSIPFIEELKDIFDSERINEKGLKDKRLSFHTTCMVRFAELLTDSDFRDIVNGDGDLMPFTNLYHNILSDFSNKRLSDNDANFFRIAALFHDIGKHIEVDNHPQIGLYLVRDFFPDKRNRLIELIGTEYFALLCSIIQHHDKFGVVSTGEASLPIFADIPYHASNIETIKGVKKNFAFVCLCNLIDIAASIPFGADEPIKLDAKKINFVAEDWKTLIKTVEKSNGEREEMKKNLLEHEYKSHRAINRIERLIKSATIHYPGIGENVNSAYLEGLVSQALQCSFNEFSKGLAHITKLDYGLRFFQKLVEGVCIKHVEERYMNELKKVNDKNWYINNRIEKMGGDIKPILDEITIKILKILERFVLRYRWILTGSDRHQTSLRIGYEMRGVIGDEKLTSAIINNLLSPDSEPAVLNWITDKTPIWSFD